MALFIQYNHNPWWRDGRVPLKLVPLHHRLADDEAEKILNHADLRRFVILSGARRIDKTTIMYRLIDALLQKGVLTRNIVYLSFDNPRLRYRSIKGFPQIKCGKPFSVAEERGSMYNKVIYE